LNEDLRDIFPYNALTEDLVLDRNSKFGNLTIKDYSENIILEDGDIDRFIGKGVYELTKEYTSKDIDILYRSLVEIERLYNEIGYSITDSRYQGIASIAYGHSLKDIQGNEFKCFEHDLYNKWKDCFLGGICETKNFNLNKRRYTYTM
jgi:hypothetical protein